jgi:hypothetical protein
MPRDNYENMPTNIYFSRICHVTHMRICQWMTTPTCRARSKEPNQETWRKGQCKGNLDLCRNP